MTNTIPADVIENLMTIQCGLNVASDNNWMGNDDMNDLFTDIVIASGYDLEDYFEQSENY